jgi:hypothetical protein
MEHTPLRYSPGPLMEHTVDPPASAAFKYNGERQGKDQLVHWLYRLPFVLIGLATLITCSITPHTFGIITSIIYLFFISMYSIKSYHENNSCQKVVLRATILMTTLFNVLLLIVGFSGFISNPYPLHFPVMCNTQHSKHCSILCKYSKYPFPCQGRYRVHKNLPLPTLNATSMLHASDLVQDVMSASGIFIDSVTEIKATNSSSSSSSINTAMYIKGHAVTSFWGFVDIFNVLIQCGGSGSSSSDYDVWIVSQSLLGNNDFHENESRIQLFATNLNNIGNNHRNNFKRECSSTLLLGVNDKTNESAVTTTAGHSNNSIRRSSHGRHLLSMNNYGDNFEFTGSHTSLKSKIKTLPIPTTTPSAAAPPPTTTTTTTIPTTTPTITSTTSVVVEVGAEVLVRSNYKQILNYTKIGIIADPTTILPKTMVHLIDQMIIYDLIYTPGRNHFLLPPTVFTLNLRNKINSYFFFSFFLFCLFSSVLENVVVFAPEHGFRGASQAGHGDKNKYVDMKTGVTVYNTYGLNQSSLRDLILETNIDALIFDIQDVGSRFYTFIWTM